jgi:enoyl-CoA hydratase/carnithine racemase
MTPILRAQKSSQRGVSSPGGTLCSLTLLRDTMKFQQAIGAPERCPFRVIVALDGFVLDLGVDIVSARDARYAAEGAQFSIKVRHYLNLLPSFVH